MIIRFTQKAKDRLDSIYQYCKDKSLGRAGRKIRSKIIGKTLQLKEFPYSGPEDELVKPLGLGHRFLIEGDYKIVYRVESNEVIILEIFDTRQDPEKLLDF